MRVLPPLLILMAGMPGSGKSTLARALGSELGFLVVDKDVILSALLDDDIPEGLAQAAAYRVMFEIGETFLAQGFSTALDSPAGLPESVSAARAVCRRTSSHLVTVLCSAEQDVRNERVAARESLPSQPVGISTTPGNARERFVHLPADTIEVDTMEPLESVIQDVVISIRATVRV